MEDEMELGVEVECERLRGVGDNNSTLNIDYWIERQTVLGQGR